MNLSMRWECGVCAPSSPTLSEISLFSGILSAWLREGCLVQITASSLTGRFGRTAQSFAFDFLDKNWVHFIATDAHNLTSRPPIMSEAYKILEDKYGRETAQRLCVENPRAAFEGAPLPPQPDLLGLVGELEGKQKKGFFSRLFAGS